MSSGRSPEAADRLLGDLADELAAAVRSQLELNALRRAPRRRGVLADLAVLLGGGIAALLAAGAGTASVVLGLAGNRAWIAAAVAAGAWGVVALATLRGERARRVLAAVAPEVSDEQVAEAELEARRRIDVLRATAQRLARTIERDALQRLRGEAVAAALAPARATLDLLRGHR